MFSPSRDDVDAGSALDQATEPGSQHVVDGPLPAAHAGADGFLLDVLRDGSTFLGELGAEGSRQVAGWVEWTLFSLEEQFLGVFAEHTAQASMHGLLFGAAQDECSDFGWIPS